MPTPVVGGVGLIADAHRAVDLRLKNDGGALILVGETKGHLGASLYLREIEGQEAGPPPPVDLAAERRNGDFVRAMIEAGHVAACHDVSDGGLLVALAEMAMAGGLGATLAALPNSPHPNPPPLAGVGAARAASAMLHPPPQAGEGGVEVLPPLAWLFGEDQARYLIETAAPDALLREGDRARRPGATHRHRGRRRVDTPRRRCHIGRGTQGRERGVAAGLYGTGLTRGNPMAMDAGTIERLIKESLPDARVSIEDLRGDGDHYAAHVVSNAFRGKTRVQQHQLVYQALGGRMGGELHALALQTSAPED